MYVDFAIWLNNYIITLEEPTRIIFCLCFYVGLPLICILLIYIDKKIESERF